MSDVRVQEIRDFASTHRLFSQSAPQSVWPGPSTQRSIIHEHSFYQAAAIEIGTDHAQRCTAHRRMPGSSDHVLAAGHTVHLRQLALEALALL